MNKIVTFYYLFTCYFPRKLPTNEHEFEWMKNVLQNAYGVPDDPAAWATVAGHVTSTPAVRIRRPWGDIANAAKRLKINAVAQNERSKAFRQLETKLAAELAAVALELNHDENEKEESYTQDLEEAFKKEGWEKNPN